MNEIIVALITGGVTLIGMLISNQKAQAVTETRIDELTREVREHNIFARRMPVKEPSKERMDNYVTAYADSQTVHHAENIWELFTDIANAIRVKSGTSDQIFACEFADRIRKL